LFASSTPTAMALPAPSTARQPMHRRAVEIEAFQRDDGLYDLDARLTDVKTQPLELISGIREAGDPVHDLCLRITIDAGFTIVAVETGAYSVPNPGVCETVGPMYQRLVGLNLLRGFRKAVQSRVGRTDGCTHLSELSALLPTVALQTFGHLVKPTEPDPSVPPFFIGQCHAYDRSGEVVRRHYPQWFIQAD
jgi:hypothetical protein